MLLTSCLSYSFRITKSITSLSLFNDAFKSQVFRNNGISLRIYLLKKKIRLFLVFSCFISLIFIAINTRTFVKANNKCKKYENCFENFHLLYITRKVKRDCNNKVWKYYLVISSLRS